VSGALRAGTIPATDLDCQNVVVTRAFTAPLTTQVKPLNSLGRLSRKETVPFPQIRKAPEASSANQVSRIPGISTKSVFGTDSVWLTARKRSDDSSPGPEAKGWINTEDGGGAGCPPARSPEAGLPTASDKQSRRASFFPERVPPILSHPPFLACSDTPHTGASATTGLAFLVAFGGSLLDVAGAVPASSVINVVM